MIGKLFLLDVKLQNRRIVVDIELSDGWPMV
jgi:hypothetical protein